MTPDERIIEGDGGELFVGRSLVGELESIRSAVTTGFTRLTTRLDGLEKRTAALESWRHDRDVAAGIHQSRDTDVFTRRQKLWGVLGAVLTLAALWAAVVVSLVH